MTTLAIAYTGMVMATVITPFVVRFTMLALDDILAPLKLPVTPGPRDTEEETATWKAMEMSSAGVVLGIFIACFFLVDNIIAIHAFSTVCLSYLFAMLAPFFGFAVVWLLFWSIRWTYHILVERGERPIWRRIDSIYAALKQRLTGK